MGTLKPVACHHQGADLIGQVAVPEGSGRRPAVLVMANAHGLGNQVKRSARLLAERGYVALATDMYGHGALSKTNEETGALMGPLHQDPAKLRSRVVAWFEELKARSDVDPGRIAAIGYCFGGQCVLELARSGADVKAVVSYHGLLTTHAPAKPGMVKAQVAVYTGAKDPYAPRAHVDALQDEMVAAGVRWQLTTFGDTYHSFTDPEADARPLPGLKYSPLAERLSWDGTLALLTAAFA